VNAPQADLGKLDRLLASRRWLPELDLGSRKHFNLLSNENMKWIQAL
jgi:hypothetical protein